MLMVFAGGHISGGHYNPAVTLAVLLRGKCPLRDAITYWIAQILAAFVAVAVVSFLKGYPQSQRPGSFIPVAP
jgi:aquaporin Z